MTQQQEDFARAYVANGGDVEQAYQSAKFSTNSKGWKTSAQQLLYNPKIKERIERLQKRATMRNDVDVDWLVQEFKATYQEARAAGSFKDAINALTKLGEWAQMFRAKEGGGTPNVNVYSAFMTGDPVKDAKRIEGIVVDSE